MNQDPLSIWENSAQDQAHDQSVHETAVHATAVGDQGATAPASASTPASASILVVDDTEHNRDMLSRRLERQGHRVTCVSNGREALESLEQHVFDAVLLDIAMPEMDGFEALERIKTDARWMHLPVIMISAIDDIDSVVRCLEIGADDYLPKPFSPAILKARLNSSLQRKRAHDRERALTSQLQANFKRLENLEKSRDHLTHLLIHDLRSPLTANLAGIEMVAMVGELNQQQKDVLNIALRSGHNLLGLINDLLDVSKMEDGALQLEKSEVTVTPLVAEVLEQVAPLTNERRLDVHTDIAPDAQTVIADKDKLRRILVNLISNAIKFSATNGEIAISARREGEQIVFAIRDTGEGIPAEALGRIFDKFSQVETRKSGRKMSTGLGLNFCKLAVEQHGGNIWAQSELERGSTFYFALPLLP